MLVQWERLHADDTSWEDWDNLKRTYHLEDKVLPDGVENDRKWAEENTVEMAHDVAMGRPKREVHMPKYLEDFIT